MADDHVFSFLDVFSFQFAKEILRYLSIDESPEAEQHLWHVRQIFLDENADGDFRIEADVNLDATQEEGEVIFKNYRVGFVEDLAE